MRHGLGHIVKHLVDLALVMLVLSFMVFVLARVIPGDPARIALGPSASQQQVDALRQQMGLNQPILVQYVSYLAAVARGDFGKSLISGNPVSREIAQLLPATLELVLVTVVLMILISLPLGVLTARYHNSWFDHTGRFVSILGVTVPGFLFAILLQLMAARFFPHWPILGRVDSELSPPTGPTGMLLIDSLVHHRADVFVDGLKHLLFPTLSLSLAGIGQVVRLTRSAMLDYQRRDHVLTLRSFGVSQPRITFYYLFKLSSIAPLTIMGLQLASLIGNAFVVEMVFSWGGFASYGLEAILQKDLNALMAVVLVSGLFFVAANLLVDVLLLLLDPRQRESR